MDNNNTKVAGGRIGHEDSAWRRLLGQNEFILFIVLIVVFVLGTVLYPKMLGSLNLFNIARNTAFIGMCALGSTLVILVGEFDISQGSLIGFSAVIGGLALQAGANSWVAALVTILSGAALGLFNGFLVVKLRIPNLMATLGTMQLYSALAMMVSNSQVIYVYDEPAYSIMGQSSLLLPTPTIIFAVVACVLWFVLSRTRFGKQFYFTGANMRAAYLSGVPCARIKLIAFAIAGMCASVTGIFLASQSNFIIATTGSDYSLTGICVAVLGGIMIGGGKGKIMGTVIAAFLFQIIINILTLSGFGTYLEMLLKGVLLVLIVAAYQLMERLRARSR